MQQYRFATQSGKIVAPNGAEITYVNHVLTVPDNFKHQGFIDELVEAGLCYKLEEEVAVETDVVRVAPKATVGQASSSQAGPQGVKVSVSKAK